jgi:4-hydroxy-3-methylbut-2-enyl diphosphate reductase IspH
LPDDHRSIRCRRNRQRDYGANPDREIRFVNTICHPTRSRQEAVLELLEKVDALVVVGGRNSNNTRQLVNLAQDPASPRCTSKQRRTSIRNGSNISTLSD